MHPLVPYFRGEETAAAPAPGLVPEVLSHDRHRERRQHRRATSRSSRCSATSRSATTSSRRPSSGPGICRRRASASTPTTSGSRSSRATRSSASARTRRRSRRGCRSACRASGSSCARARRTSGRPATSGPCGPCSELYIDRGLEWGTAEDLPGGENERFLEYWNLVFTQYDLTTHADGSESLAPLPASNIDTGLGLERMAVIQQGVDTVFETDTFAPLMALGRELASADPTSARCASSPTTRAR